MWNGFRCKNHLYFLSKFMPLQVILVFQNAFCRYLIWKMCSFAAVKRRKTIGSKCRIVSPFKCKACDPPPNLRSALLDTLKNECFSITKMLNSKKMFNCNYFHTHYWILWGLFLNYVKIDQMVQDVKLFSLAAIFYIYLNGK